MGMTNTEKQSAWRARKQAMGLVHFQAWVTPEQAPAIRELLAGKVTSNRQTPEVIYNQPVPGKGKRRRKLENPVSEKNAQIIEAHRAEILARREAGEKPTETAEWLQQFGFVGTGATLNGFMPWR